MEVGSHLNFGLMDALMPLMFMLPAFFIVLYSIYFYQKNGYAADKIVEDQNKWMYRKASVKRLGKKWAILHFTILGSLLILGCVNFFTESLAVKHFMLIAAMPAAVVLITIYIIALLVFNRKKDEEEEDTTGHFGA